MDAGRSLAEFVAKPTQERRAVLQADAGHTAHLVYEAACYGLVEAQTALGQMLLDGRGTPADAAAGRRWFALAARAGHAEAANMLGRCLERGWGGAPDTVSAAEWYRKAAEAGLDWGQYNLANMLLRGRGVARDVQQSFAWFEAAATQGHAKSMNLMARFLEEGWLGTVDLAEAQIWYRRAALGGDFRGQYNLACMLCQNGRLAEALGWFRKAAADGSFDFRRMAADELLAHREAAIRQVGLAFAQTCCQGGAATDFYRYGAALAAQPDANKRVAAAWLHMAEAAGHPDASAALADIAVAMPATIIRHARRLLDRVVRNRSDARLKARPGPAANPTGAPATRDSSGPRKP